MGLRDWLPIQPLVIAVAGLLLAATLAAAQAPAGVGPAGIAGADVEVMKAGRLESTVLRLLAGNVTTSWLAYEVVAEPGQGRMCCFNSEHACCGGCRLESGGWFRGGHQRDADPVRLESGPRLRVFLRLEGGLIDRVQMYSEDCAIDAEGVHLVWLGSADPSDSLGLLSQLAEGVGPVGVRVAERDEPGMHMAIAAIAAHAGNDPLELLLDWARHDPRTDLRSQAIFWLAQRAGERAAATIDNAVHNDPDEEVKVQAVFALSQLPADRGVPMLIRIARTHRIPKVRRQALFWLGQSGDERALDFIEEVLGSR